MRDDNVRIEAVSHADDLIACFEAFSAAFSQAQPLMNGLNPLHNTPRGRQKGIARFQAEWLRHRHDSRYAFIKAVVEDNAIAGYAIWTEMSAENVTDDDASREFDLDALYSDLDDAEAQRQREWIKQVWKAYVRPRRRVVAESATSVMCLELCLVHPAFQRRGIGLALTQWGIRRAKSEAHMQHVIVEASVSGIGCYARAGFRQQEWIDFSDCEAALVQQVRPFPRLAFMQLDL